MKAAGFAALAALATAGPAAEPLPSPSDLIRRHHEAALRRDVDALMADYADDAVVLQARRAIDGKPAIRAFYQAALGGPRPAGAPRMAMTVTRIWHDGNVGHMTWTSGTSRIFEHFVTRNGKITVQALMADVDPLPR